LLIDKNRAMGTIKRGSILDGGHFMTIEKTMTIAAILNVDQGIADILMESGMSCLGCAMAHGETLEQACAVHGVDAEALTAKINDYLANK
jgi:hybrid cluster-associated redox disulfide protein